MRRIAIVVWALGGVIFVLSQLAVGVLGMPLWIGVLAYVSLAALGAVVWGRSDPVYDYRAAAEEDGDARVASPVIERSRDPRVP